MSKSSHHLIKTILIPQVASLLIEKYAVSEDDAIRIVYMSPTGKCLDDASLGLFGQSAQYLFGLLEEDISKNPDLLKTAEAL